MSVVGWVAGPLVLFGAFVAFAVRAWRRAAEPLRVALGGWFPFGSAVLHFERDGVEFALQQRDGWNLLTARGAAGGRWLVGRAGSRSFVPLDAAVTPLDEVSRPGMQLLVGADEPGLRARLRELVSGTGVSWGRLLPLDHAALTWGGAVLTLHGVSPAVWTAPPTQFLGQLDALLRLARALDLGLRGRR